MDVGGGFAGLGPAVSALSSLVKAGWDLVVTHGNAPQVGERLIAALPGTPTLDVLDAETEGSLGYRLQQTLGNALTVAGTPRLVASLVTQVVVDAADPAFLAPSKPIGPFYDEVAAAALRERRGWLLVEDAGRGYRRVVPSPRPLDVVEWPAVAALLAAHAVVIAGGGGGIPVVREDDGTLQGVDAVIDKDRVTSLLARRLAADMLVILTGVPEVYLDYRSPNQRAVRTLTVSEARGWLRDGQFAPGSMGPKVESAAAFVAATGWPAFITSSERLADALAGTAGTRIEP